MLPNLVCQLRRRIHSVKEYLAELHLYQRKRFQYLVVVLMNMLVNTLQGSRVFMEVVGLCILDFCLANKLAITNTFFRKNKSSLISFLSGGNHTQIAFILLRRAQLKNIKDTKVIKSEECITQHKNLVCCISKNCKTYSYSTKK